MSYQLSQVQGALYAVFTGSSHDAYKRLGNQPSQTFRNRIKRLLDIDRAAGRERRRGNAFSEVLPDGSGKEFQYEAFDAFCLAIGLELLRFGFKQAEVVDKLRDIRPYLSTRYSYLEETIETLGPTTHVIDHGSKLPRKKTGRNQDQEMADPRMFLVLDNLENSRGTAAKEDLCSATARGPQVCHGSEGLRDYLDRRLHNPSRSFFIIELSDFSARLRELLERQPVVRRGPQVIDGGN